MNRTLRVLMLSLFAVMLAVSSAFAAEIAPVGDEYPEATELSLYSARYQVTDLAAGATVKSWDITLLDEESSPIAGGWLEIVSLDNPASASVTGYAPAFDPSEEDPANEYTFRISALVSSDTLTTLTYDLTVTVTDAQFSTFSNDLVAYSPDNVIVYEVEDSASRSNDIGPDFSVTLTFKAMPDNATAPMLQLFNAEEYGYTVSPSWLQYEILSYYVEDDNQSPVKELRIFYSSDTAPENGAVGHVRITGGADNTNKYNTPVVAFDVRFVPLFDLSPDVQAASVTAGSSVDVTFTIVSKDGYCSTISTDADTAFSFTVSPDAKGITLALVQSDDEAIFTVGTTASTDAGTYSLDVVVYDIYGTSTDVTIALTVSALSFDLSPDVVAAGVTAGSSVDVTFTIVSKDGYCTSLDVASFDVSADEGITATVKQSGDLAIVTVTVTSAVSADVHSVDLTFYDVYGTSKDAAITLTVYSGDIAIDLPSGASAPVITAGGSTDVLIDISNYYGSSSDLQFAVNNVPEGFSLAFKEFSGDYAVFTLTSSSDVAAGTYSADIVVTDKAGRTGTYNLTWTVSDSTAKYFTVSPDKTAVTAYYNVSTDVVVPFYYAEPSTDWYYSPDISGDFEMLRTYIVSEDESGDVYGTMTITVRPLVKLEETYYYTLTFIGVDSVEASLDLTINVVVPAISLRPSTVTLAATVGSSASQDITYANAVPTGYKFSPDKVPSAFNFALTSSDSTKKITVTITPTSLAVSDDYSGTLIISDDNGKSGSVAISMRAAAPRPVGTLTIASVPDQNLVAGQSKDVALSATNNVGVVKWATRRVPSALTVARSTTLAATSGDVRPVYTITAAATASGDYSFDVVASDDTGETKTVTVKVNVKGLDAKMQELYRQGYITVGADGTIMLTAAAFESDSGFETIGSLVIRSIRLKFPVDVWTLYIDNNTVVVAEEGYENEVSSAAGEKGDITPSTDKQGAVFEIDTTSLTVGTHAVKIGAIPTGSNMEAFYNFEPITVSETGAYGVGSASSGCDAGLGMLVSALAAAFFIGRKRS